MTLSAIRQDAGHTLRILRRSPVFTATAVFTLALAIGGNTAIFTVIRGVLLKPLDYPEPDRLVHIMGGATPTRFAEMRAAARSYAGLAAFTSAEDIALTGVGEPEIVKAVHVSAGFLRILDVAPMLGRDFLPREDSAAGTPVALISYELWQRRFAADPHIIGKSAAPGATPCTIVGVLPPHFRFPFPGLDVWMTDPSDISQMPPRMRALTPFLTVFGRLKPGATLAQADAEMRVIHHEYATAHPGMLDAKSKTPVEVTPMKDALVRDVRSMLWMLFDAVGLLLLIACANVAGLLLARAASRSREFAVRSALGAGRSRLIGQMLVESALLALASGALGVMLAGFGVRTLAGLTSFDLPRAAEVHLDWTVLAFAAALSIATGVLFGLAPSLGASRTDLMSVLRAPGEGAGSAGSRTILPHLNLRGLLSVGQIAFSMVLLIGVALLMESIAHLRGLDLGFNPNHLLTMSVSLPPSRYDTPVKQDLFFQELLRQIDTLAGVRDATVAMTLPMGPYAGIPIQDASKPPRKLNERPIARYQPVMPGYFRTLGIPLRRGRDFTDHDTRDSQRVAIVDERFARRFWPAYPGGIDPIGQRIFVGIVNPKPAQIVGIAADTRQTLEDPTWPDGVYVSINQAPQPFGMLAIRTSGDPLSLSRAIRERVRAVDPDQAVNDIQTMDDLVDAQTGQRRLLATLLGSFAGVALVLALVGIYGVIAWSVSERTREMGIRRALGAQQSDILRLILGQGLGLALAGIAAGLAGAFAATRVMSALLFHVSATDPATFAAVALCFLLIALAASFIPAHRASRIDPATALRV
jgi:predicted permease